LIEGFKALAKAPRRKEAELCAFASLRGLREAMTENEIAKVVVNAAYKIHTTLGPGLLESVCVTVLAYELEKAGLRVSREVAVPVVYESVHFDAGFRADLIVEDKVIVELKSIESVAPVHKKQLLTYLRLADKRLGLLINFGEALIKEGITRIVNALEE
jgi:GxxExxY protein